MSNARPKNCNASVRQLAEEAYSLCWATVHVRFVSTHRKHCTFDVVHSW